MTHARIYQQGVKAFLDAIPLGGNPHDPAVKSDAHEAWEDGWLDANRSRWRRHAFEMAVRASVKPLRASSIGSA
jgi:hypothetical protein